MTILDKAKAVVDGPRRSDYGPPLKNHQRTAVMWSAYLSVKYPGIRVNPRDVCLMNALQKCSRDANKPTEDNLVDIAGWARNAEIVTGEVQEGSDEEAARVESDASIVASLRRRVAGDEG